MTTAPVPRQLAPGVIEIDTLLGGWERVTAGYLIEGPEPVLVETGSQSSVPVLLDALAAHGVSPGDLAGVAVTHIHLDHAGGVGAIADRYPRASIWVHERGAPHLVDPAKLVASATMIYGRERMASLFGDVRPVPADRIRALAGGDTIELGGRSLVAWATPGHAKHQVALVDSVTGAVFTGDALGIHPPDLPALRPATPPPDYDLELAVDSIERIRALAGELLLFSHFGPVRDVDQVCDLAIRRFRDWTEAVRVALDRGADLDEVVEVLERVARSDVATGAEAELDVTRFETLSSTRMNAMGIVRYWTKRREREAAEPEG